MADVYVSEEGSPAYAMSHTGSGPQCSHSSEYCFFCEHASDGSCGDGDVDLRATLVTLVNLLHREKKEVSVIVDTVACRYNEQIKMHVDGEMDWPKSSIRRHLLYSSEFSQLFDGVVTQIFHTIVYNLNDNLMGVDGQVDEEKRRAFVDTVKALQGWLKTSDRPAKRHKGE